MLYGIDIYHGDVLESDLKGGPSDEDCFATIKENCAFVFLKATQGIGVTDPLYHARRVAAQAAELLIGAYHFNTGDTIPAQVQHFLDAAKPDIDLEMALDFEDNKANQMTFDEMYYFLQLMNKELTKIAGKTRYATLYSGNRIKRFITAADPATKLFLGLHKFWGCEYGPKFKMVDDNGKQLPWNEPWIWQFTGDGIGPNPHTFKGLITKAVDVNSYSGDLATLTGSWAR